MDYLTTKEVSVLWNTTEQMVRRYCRDGRIPGAVQKEGSWYVPEGTARPTRKKQEAPTVPKLVNRSHISRPAITIFPISRFPRSTVPLAAGAVCTEII